MYTIGMSRTARHSRTKIWHARRLASWAFHCSSRHKRQNQSLASPGKKVSFSVAAWPILDPLFLVLVGTASGRLKIHLPGWHLSRNGLSSIAVFAMLCMHGSIWSYCFHHFAASFLSGSESHQDSPLSSFDSEAKKRNPVAARISGRGVFHTVSPPPQEFI